VVAAVATFRVTDGLISNIWLTMDPDKLSTWLVEPGEDVD
jgi:hypothetical protein